MTPAEREELSSVVNGVLARDVVTVADEAKRHTVVLAAMFEVLLSIDERMEKTEKMAAQFDKVSSGGNALLTEVS